MKKILISKKKYAIVDDENFEKLNKVSWACWNGYAVRREKGKIIRMHRVILQTPNNMFTDHINGDKLDNRRSNLRICTYSQNKMNTKKHQDNTSGFKGVCWDKQMNKWRVRICVNYKIVFQGLFKSKIEAAEAYNQRAVRFFGEFANVNKV